ncbi:uncharacterized protein Eint_041530 [Encephalitozoon intestinalis ATCC 50506]|uniref:Uncharacterized protein n=1 Tax=Encephalitozoon intestinalis (strain ATCC 50506) TaxID=876142 RepID=E0S6V5_ENCIT|nr:uncharacterized protein Eint_041530 [Encephalitozoon intestinalis ATCC 50506]ADM11440.1 hypothetical protein Eint_041530 [Encephalitozoon intestinalis ATCC 50506]UTX45136.1 hypothetical protein GPK93_04g06760 [Encephalitozoon intestinalis]
MEVKNGIDYVFRGSRDEVKQTFKFQGSAIVLTPYRSKCSGLAYLEDSEEIVMTPKMALERSFDKMKGGHVIVEDCELMDGFGYMEDLICLKRKGISFILLNAQKVPKFAENPVFISSNRYFIKATKDERYAAIFALCKIYKNVCIICKDVERMKMFSEIFKLNLDVVGHGDAVDGRSVVIVMDGLVNIKCEKLFYVGDKCKGMKTMVLDTSKIGKFLYRVRDVCNMLSPGVVRGKKELNINRFRGIEK